jgi:hypothetical protein
MSSKPISLRRDLIGGLAVVVPEPSRPFEAFCHYSRRMRTESRTAGRLIESFDADLAPIRARPELKPLVAKLGE